MAIHFLNSWTETIDRISSGELAGKMLKKIIKVQGSKTSEPSICTEFEIFDEYQKGNRWFILKGCFLNLRASIQKKGKFCPKFVH